MARYLAPLSALLALVLGASPSLAGDTLDQIEESGVIKLGYRTDAAPLASLDPAGVPTGYSIELCERIAKEVQRSLDRELDIAFVPVTSVDRFEKLEAGEIDLLCGATTVTLERRERMDFTSLTFVTGAAMMIRADGDLRDLEEAEGRTLGVLAGTTSADGLDRALKEEGITAEIVYVDDHPAGFAAVLAGEIDAYVADRALLLGLALNAEDPSAVGISRRLYSIESYAIPMRRGDTELRLIADKTLAGLYEGEIHEIFRDAFGEQAEPGNMLLALYQLQAYQP